MTIGVKTSGVGHSYTLCAILVEASIGCSFFEALRTLEVLCTALLCEQIGYDSRLEARRELPMLYLVLLLLVLRCLS